MKTSLLLYLRKIVRKNPTIWNSAKALQWIIKFVDIQQNV